ncbi:uncharacterized protein N7459_009478 [Penicillium hispanicum]|uniref:uncharacterized protein n=1 Tax=Penicillium hispanicum TaxID=1080232 RepID=UPI00253FD756|nr:uncharacterized protein N7459_009478 [Penicillium hispanicum]KAJ5570048.1 hypothetical protein N7459_009478 [Penicillium hispanicum]
MARNELTDTKLRHNLLDGDFVEDSKALPPPRPDTDATPVSYLIDKSRPVAVFAAITDHLAATQSSAYPSTIRLDRQL